MWHHHNDDCILLSCNSFINPIQTGGGGGAFDATPIANDCVYSVPTSWLFLKLTWEQFGVVRFWLLISLLSWQSNSGILLRSYLVHSCFHFNFYCLLHLNIDKTDYIIYLMKLFNKFEAKKSVLTAFWQSPKIQDGRHENPRWRLNDVMWRHSWGMIVAIDLSYNA